MRILLDTHVFLWYIAGSVRMSDRWRVQFQDPGNEVFLSVVSVWEASIKYAIGKLKLPDAPGTYLPAQRKRHQIASLSLDEQSVCRLGQLPPAHRDPFDRMLACQTIEHQLTLATVDPLFSHYPVPLLPA